MNLPVDYDSLKAHEKKPVRDEYVRIQKGRCYFCDMPLSGKACKSILSLPIDLRFFPPNFLKYPVHLHHSHDTGKTLGAVHSYCNAVLWQYKGE